MSNLKMLALLVGLLFASQVSAQTKLYLNDGTASKTPIEVNEKGDNARKCDTVVTVKTRKGMKDFDLYKGSRGGFFIYRTSASGKVRKQYIKFDEL